MCAQNVKQNVLAEMIPNQLWKRAKMTPDGFPEQHLLKVTSCHFEMTSCHHVSPISFMTPRQNLLKMTSCHFEMTSCHHHFEMTSCHFERWNSVLFFRVVFLNYGR